MFFWFLTATSDVPISFWLMISLAAVVLLELDDVAVEEDELGEDVDDELVDVEDEDDDELGFDELEDELEDDGLDDEDELEEDAGTSVVSVADTPCTDAVLLMTVPPLTVGRTETSTVTVFVLCAGTLSDQRIMRVPRVNRPPLDALRNWTVDGSISCTTTILGLFVTFPIAIV